MLAVMENVANTEDILRLRECLADWQAKGARPERQRLLSVNRVCWKDCSSIKEKLFLNIFSTSLHGYS